MSSILVTICFSFFIFFSSSADAFRFNVGGSGVWIPNPLENYQTWSGRTRFQINDTIYFKYPKGSDSVQLVMPADFYGCNTRNPLKSYDDGESVIELKHSGAFYFISGNQEHCKKGQKLLVTVLSVRPPTAHAPASSPSSQASPPKSSSPISPAKPPTNSQPPKSVTPVSPIAPAKPPTKAQPPKSSYPVAPKKSPVTPPSPLPSGTTPAEAPKIDNIPPTSSPSSDGPTAPAPSPKSSASGVTVMTVMTTLSTVAFTLFMFV